MLKNWLPEKIKQCSRNDLNVLSDELRRIIYQTVTTRGGHLASNLGAVESTVALFYTFDFPRDKIVFDVGHQCYPYKLLSGRLDRLTPCAKQAAFQAFLSARRAFSTVTIQGTQARPFRRRSVLLRLAI